MNDRYVRKRYSELRQKAPAYTLVYEWLCNTKIIFGQLLQMYCNIVKRRPKFYCCSS